MSGKVIIIWARFIQCSEIFVFFVNYLKTNQWIIKIPTKIYSVLNSRSNSKNILMILSFYQKLQAYYYNICICYIFMQNSSSSFCL